MRLLNYYIVSQVRGNTMNKNIVIGLCIIALLTMWIIKKPVEQIPPNSIFVGTNAEFPPYTFFKDGQLTGFDIELITLIAQQLKRPLNIKDMSFDGLVIQAQQGRIDVIAAGLTETPERAKRLLFTPAYITNDPFIIVSLRNKNISHLSDLGGKKVVVNEGFTAERFMEEQPNVTLIRLATVSEAILAITTGQADAFVTAQGAITPFLKQHTINTIVATPIPNTGDSIALAISRKKPELAQEITDIVTQFSNDGTIATLKQKWNL